MKSTNSQLQKRIESSWFTLQNQPGIILIEHAYARQWHKFIFYNGTHL